MSVSKRNHSGFFSAFVPLLPFLFFHLPRATFKLLPVLDCAPLKHSLLSFSYFSYHHFERPGVGECFVPCLHRILGLSQGSVPTFLLLPSLSPTCEVRKLDSLCKSGAWAGPPRPLDESYPFWTFNVIPRLRIAYRCAKTLFTSEE